MPCKHTFGSRCITKWLDPMDNAKNSCPLCRFSFFPAQPRPYLEHGVMGDDAAFFLDHERLVEDGDGPFLEHEEEVIEDAEGRFSEDDEVVEDDEGPSSEHDEVVEDGEGPSPEHEEATGDDEGIAHDIPEDFRGRGDAVNERQENVPGLETIQNICEIYCIRLNLNTDPRAIGLAQRYAHFVVERTHLAFRNSSMSPPYTGYFSAESIAAYSVYQALPLVGLGREYSGPPGNDLGEYRDRILGTSGVDISIICRLNSIIDTRGIRRRLRREGSL